MIYNILTGIFGALSAVVLGVFVVQDRKLRKDYRGLLIEEFTKEENAEGANDGEVD